MRKFIIFLLLIAAVSYLTYDFISSGKCEEFILSHSDKDWAPRALYYLGDIYLIFGDRKRAEGVYKKVIEKYPKSKYCEKAMFMHYYIPAYEGNSKETVRRGKKYLKRFPDSERAHRIRKRINVLD
ncbi:MAG: tetratricopeptide repeat protein [Elusimicrobiota bacterium]